SCSVLVEPPLVWALDLDEYRVEECAVVGDPHEVRSLRGEVRKSRLSNDRGRPWIVPGSHRRAERTRDKRWVPFEELLYGCFLRERCSLDEAPPLSTQRGHIPTAGRRRAIGDRGVER